MIERIREEKFGLALILIMLMVSIGVAILFGIWESVFKNYAASIASLPGMAPEKVAGEADKIWRYIQRFHFHSGGVVSYSLALFMLVISLDLCSKVRRLTTIALGLHNLYPFTWLVTFYYAPKMGRNAAKHLFLSELFVYISVISFGFIMAVIIGNIYFKKFQGK